MIIQIYTRHPVRYLSMHESFILFIKLLLDAKLGEGAVTSLKFLTSYTGNYTQEDLEWLYVPGILIDLRKMCAKAGFSGE